MVVPVEEIRKLLEAGAKGSDTGTLDFLLRIDNEKAVAWEMSDFLDNDSFAVVSPVEDHAGLYIVSGHHLLQFLSLRPSRFTTAVVCPVFLS